MQRMAFNCSRHARRGIGMHEGNLKTHCQEAFVCNVGLGLRTCSKPKKATKLTRREDFSTFMKNTEPVKIDTYGDTACKDTRLRRK